MAQGLDAWARHPEKDEEGIWLTEAEGVRAAKAVIKVIVQEQQRGQTS